MQFRLTVVVAGLTRMEQVLDQEVAELLMDKIEMEVVIMIVLVVMVIVITDIILIIFIARKLWKWWWVNWTEVDTGFRQLSTNFQKSAMLKTLKKFQTSTICWFSSSAHRYQFIITKNLTSVTTPSKLMLFTNSHFKWWWMTIIVLSSLVRPGPKCPPWTCTMELWTWKSWKGVLSFILSPQMQFNLRCVWKGVLKFFLNYFYLPPSMTGRAAENCVEKGDLLAPEQLQWR